MIYNRNITEILKKKTNLKIKIIIKKIYLKTKTQTIIMEKI